MQNTTLSLRQLARHVPEQLTAPCSFRKLVRKPTGPFSLKVRFAPFSVMTHNMALLVAPGNYLGTDRKGIIDELVARIRALSPDVVGLNEVFSNGEREHIRSKLRDLYPYFQEGPDKDGFDLRTLKSDGGLLILSKHPLLAAHAFIYHDCDGTDCFANKGMIHIRIQGPSWPTALDVFCTHAQNISTSDGTSTLYSQLTKMQVFIQQHADPALPGIIMGDLNIPAGDSQHYAQLLGRLTGIRDCWTIAGNSIPSGSTVIRENNFYEDVDDRPARDERLDYVLLRAGIRAIPIVSLMEVLKFTRNGRFISDHFGVRTVFGITASLA